MSGMKKKVGAIVAAVMVLSSFGYLVYGGIGENLVYFLTPGELLAQGKANLQAPWLGLTAFAVVSVMLSLLVFIGEAVRDAFDPRKTFR